MTLSVPARAAALGLYALIDGVIQNWMLDPQAFDLVKTGRQVLDAYLAGLSLARSINIALGSLFGRHVPFAMRGEFLAALVLTSITVVMLAAILPARRAARLSPIEAMREE